MLSYAYDDEMDYTQGLRYQPVFRDDVSDKHEDRASIAHDLKKS